MRSPIFPPCGRLRPFSLLVALLAALSIGRAAQPGEGLVVNIAPGEVPIAVSVTAGTPALANLANLAFTAHGRYRLAAAGAAQFNLRFTAAGAAAVRVDVTKPGAAAAVLSQTATGTSLNNALLRAADLAVKATSGLNGFFASKLAFLRGPSGQAEVHTSDLFFTETFSLTGDRAGAQTPRWSPDGQRIIYTGFFQSGGADIFVIDLALNSRTAFATFKGTNSGARYSPDGRKAAMVLSMDGAREIYVSDASGRPASFTRLTRSDTTKSSPCWSPDGARLVFEMSPGPQLYLMPATGGEPQRLSIGGLSTYAAQPDWSHADPDKIAFTVQEGRNNQIAVLSLSGKFAAKVVSHKVPQAEAIEPVWLADGRHVVCTAKAANVRVLYLLDTETGKATRLSPATLGECQAASVWGP